MVIQPSQAPERPAGKPTGRPHPSASKTGPGVSTLLLGVGKHRADEEEGGIATSTLTFLEDAVLTIVPPRPPEPGRQPPNFPTRRAGRPVNPRLPQLQRNPAEAKLAGVPLMYIQTPSAVPLPGIKNPREEALWSLSSLVSAFRSQADFGQLLLTYYRGQAPAHSLVLADWLTSNRQNAFVWSRLHHKVRSRSNRRHYSLQAFAEGSVPRQQQVSRKLTYVKEWMSELDDQDSTNYSSSWLRSAPNRGNLARFFKLPPNCLLMARYVEELLAEPRNRGLLGDADRALARIDLALAGLDEAEAAADRTRL